MSWPRLWVKKAIWYHEVIKRSWNLGGSTDNKWFDNILFIIWIRIARDSIAARRTSSILLRYTNRKRQAAISDSSCTKEEDVWFYDSFRKQQNRQRFRIWEVRDTYSNIHTRSTTCKVCMNEFHGWRTHQQGEKPCLDLFHLKLYRILLPTSCACMIHL